MKTTYDVLRRNLVAAVESAISQDRERCKLAREKGQELLLMRLIGPDGRTLDGLPNPWIAGQGEDGSLPFYMADMVAYAAKRGAAGVVISGPAFVDLPEDPDDAGVCAKLAVIAAAKQFVAAFNESGIALLAVQAGDVETIEPALRPDGEMRPGLAAFFHAQVDDESELPTLADISAMLAMPDFGLDLGRAMHDEDE